MRTPGAHEDPDAVAAAVGPAARRSASGTHSTAASTTKNTELPFSDPQVVTTSANAAGQRHDRGDSTALAMQSTSQPRPAKGTRSPDWLVMWPSTNGLSP